MTTEVEAKFLNVDHQAIRTKLRSLGATLDKPMRFMKRVTINNDFLKAKNAFVRIRDEGDKTTVTYKQFTEQSVDGAKEIEIVVSNFETAVELFDTAGLVHSSYQESKRETWKLGEVEVMLDLWPWLNPYIEIEGPSTKVVQSVAVDLGFVWQDAVFGDVTAAYRAQYPHLTDNFSIGDLSEVKFDDQQPDLFNQK